MNILKGVLLCLFTWITTPFYAQFPLTWKIETVPEQDKPFIHPLGFPKTIPNDSVFVYENQQLFTHLAQLGYLQPDIQHFFSHDSVLVSTLHVGKRWESFTYDTNERELVQTILGQEHYTNTKIPIVKSQYLLSQIVQYLQNNGYPFAKAQWKNWDLSHQGNLQSFLQIDKGKSVVLTKIIIEPYFDFPVKYFSHYFKVKLNEPYQEQYLQDISNKTQALGFITSVKKPEVMFTKDSTYLFLFWEKAKKNSFDGILGFSNSTSSFRLNGHLNLSLLNTLNKGEQFQLQWLSDGAQSQQLTMKIAIPYLAKSPFEVTFDVDMYKKDTTYLNVKTQFLTLYHWQNSHTLGLQWIHQNSNTISANTVLQQDFSANWYGITYNYQKNYFGNPFISDKLKWHTTFLKGSRQQETQYLLESSLYYLWEYSKQHYITWSNQSQYLLSDYYLENELFRVGGRNSARGFREQSIPVLFYSTFWMDYHYFDTKTTTLSWLTDFTVLNTLNQSRNYLYSLGLGFQTYVNQGKLNIQYVLGNQAHIPFSVKNGVLHIQYVQNF